MTLLESMKLRQSIRSYTDEPVTEEELNMILQAAVLAPTSRDLNPADFIVVRDKAVLEGLANVKQAGGKMLKNAALAIVVAGDASRSDTWIEDCSIAMTYMHLMAASLGLGSCWVQIRLRGLADGTPGEDGVKALLGIPEQYKIEAILSIGRPLKTPAPREERSLDDPRIHIEKY